jgi:hypothetical protein
LNVLTDTFYLKSNLFDGKLSSSVKKNVRKEKEISQK